MVNERGGSEFGVKKVFSSSDECYLKGRGELEVNWS